MIKAIKRMIPQRIKNALISHEVLSSPKKTKPVHASNDTLGAMIAYNKYGGYCTPLSSQHRPAVQRILKGSIYEPDTIEFIANHCGEGDVVHAGTFFGDFLPGISKSLSNECKIWAFEPNSENYKCAEITCQLNNLQNVELFNLGLGSHSSDATMLVGTDSGQSLGGMSKIISTPNSGIVEHIRIDTIDNIVPENRMVSIIQLDVEGYEKEALEGALKTIERCKPIIILEDNNKIIESQWFADTITVIGYRVKQKIHSNTLLTT